MLHNSHGSFFTDPVETVLTSLRIHPSDDAGWVALGVSEIVIVLELSEHGLPVVVGGGFLVMMGRIVVEWGGYY